MEELENPIKFRKLTEDPRPRLSKELKALCEEASETCLSNDEFFAITGCTELGRSHNPCFKFGKPHPYNLFKLHKLSLDQIENKVIPPTRLVISMAEAPNHRLAIYLNELLKPLVEKFCKGEILFDTKDFLKNVRWLCDCSFGSRNGLVYFGCKRFISIDEHRLHGGCCDGYVKIINGF